MRRALSFFLILLFGMGPLAASLSAGADSRLPSCCRRHGVHHCAMSGPMTDEAGPGESSFTAPATCPCFPGYTAATTSTPIALAAQPLFLPSLSLRSAIFVTHTAPARLSQFATRGVRGPPIPALT